jgi:DNA/RNA endonuclease G (NUC1)
VDEHFDESRQRSRRSNRRQRNITIFRPAPFQENRTPGRDDIQVPAEFYYRWR